MPVKKRKKGLYPPQRIRWEGNSFTLQFQRHKGGDFWMVVGFKAYTDTLVIPSAHQGLPITRFYCHRRIIQGKRGYEASPGVRRLILPASIQDIWLPGEVLPGLQKVIVEEGSPFWSDGQMLYTWDGRTLVQCLVGDPEARIEVPPEVERVLDKAFQRCPSPHIHFQRKVFQFVPGKQPFRGSAWEKENDALCVGDTLVYLNEDKDLFNLPSKVTQISWNAFSVHMPMVLRIWNREAKLPRELFTQGRIISRVNFPNGNNDYYEAMTVLYTADKETLVRFPQEWAVGSYILLPETRHVGERAFYNALLGKVCLPGVTSIGVGAFSRCSFLKHFFITHKHLAAPTSRRSTAGQPPTTSDLSERYCTLPNHITTLPDATCPEDGVFAYCYKLDGLRLLAEGMRYIGRYAFYNACERTGLRLPKSIEAVGAYALVGVSPIIAYEGTAKGLMRAIYGDGGKNENQTTYSVQLRVLSRDGNREERLYLPPLTDEASFSNLEAAWQGEGFDFRSFARALSGRLGRTREERICNAWQLLSHLGSQEPDLLQDAFRGWEGEVGLSILEEQDLKAFSNFVKCVVLPLEAREILLAYCNANGTEYTQFIPFIMGRIQEGKKTDFSL